MNSGKQFELDIKKSIPPDIFYYRISDSTGQFCGGDELRFSNKQPCDSFLFDCKHKQFYALELKTTKGTSFSFEDIKKPIKYSKEIHKHQILALLEFSKYENISCGFLFNFRKKDGTQITYFQYIEDFMDMVTSIRKKSFNENDLLNYHPIKIDGKKLRKNYRWNIEKLLSDLQKIHVQKTVLYN